MRHPRTSTVVEAEGYIGGAVAVAVQKYELTFIELVGVLLRILDSYRKHALRCERHPNDEDKGADEA